MHCVYLVRSRKLRGRKSFYIGSTNDIKRRIREHNTGKSVYTSGDNWELIYCEVYKSKKDVIRREKSLKNFGAAYGHLRKRLCNSLG